MTQSRMCLVQKARTPPSTEQPYQGHEGRKFASYEAESRFSWFQNMVWSPTDLCGRQRIRSWSESNRPCEVSDSQRRARPTCFPLYHSYAPICRTRRHHRVHYVVVADQAKQGVTEPWSAKRETPRGYKQEAPERLVFFEWDSQQWKMRLVATARSGGNSRGCRNRGNPLALPVVQSLNSCPFD